LNYRKGLSYERVWDTERLNLGEKIARGEVQESITGGGVRKGRRVNFENRGLKLKGA